MHLRGANSSAKISGIARSLRARSFGELGMTSAEIYTQVIAGGGTAAEAEAASRSGDLTSFTNKFTAVPYSWSVAWNFPAPIVSLSTSGVAPYSNLSDTHYAFTDVPWPTPILNPHKTTALAWMGLPQVINRGNPRSIYDPVEYLRSALVDSDWDRVYYWFLVQYADIYKRVANDKRAYFSFADINICDYKYTVDESGQRTYYPLSPYDVKQFLTRIVANFSITDTQHSSGHCAIGLIDWSNPANIYPYDLSTLHTAFDWWTAIRQGLNTTSQGSSSVFQRESLDQLMSNARTPKIGSTPQGDLRVGWIQGPKGDWTATQIATTIVLIIIAVLTWGIGSGAIGASLAVPTTAAAQVGTAVATAATTATSALDEVIITGSLISSGVGAAISAGIVATSAIAPAITGATAPNINVTSPSLDEVVITGNVAPASSIGTSITAGSVAVATAPAVFSTSTISAPTPAPPSLDEVVITGTPASTSTVGTSITAGTIVATAAPAVLSTPNVTVQTNAPSTTDKALDEVVVSGTVPTTTVANAIAVGTVIATAAPVISNATTVSEPNTTTQPTQSNAGDSPKAGQTLKDWLAALVKKYGLAWVKQHLMDLLKQFYGHTPTQAELDDANASLSASINWWIIGAAALAAIAGSS